MVSPVETSTGPYDLKGGKFSRRGLLKFLIPSLIGIGMFLIPFASGESINIGMGFLADGLKALLGEALPPLAALILCISAVVTVLVKLTRPTWLKGSLRELFDVDWLWLALRALGALFAVMTLFQVGPGVIIASTTGGVMLNDLAPVLLTFFFFAALLLPFLVDFGFMEFIGSLVRKPFRMIFGLPGRSAIDATASWMGSGTVGVLITTQQYEQGYYNQREAAAIATNFSIVSIAFALLVASFIKINHLFIEFYLTVLVAGLIAAVIVPRLPPLSRKSNRYHEPVGCQIAEESTGGMGILRFSLAQAVARAEKSPGPGQLVRIALFNVADIFFGLLPLVVAIGTVALVLAEFTPLFTWLSYPMVPVLEWLGIPEAQAAAPATLVGFADMFLPAVLATNIESELTRFVIACLSLTQLIYMSEIGALLLKSKIPLKLWELLAIFLLRTAITLPIIALIAHVFVF
ncbi:nucleoside recognition GATE domain-containing membrane protein YjiH [Modicisalibacter ilicicola DSM 19980]|uniref:Nucleoside recognition GATE domain-containing membrane protein YjiH n=1 Tax=Modicisalibacter ilicicola DSM 19980 TaxID=1121942 RepID=A0A1M4T8A1_9GAMM|nr:YjiH family protein [Halomonas ilicicola]SHE40640.1 nucleoside recognition GATE domain-containing membrane protein YjiH [Halomonas ilicicola DSM 19980]